MSKVFAILRKENGEIANKKIIRQLFDSLKDGRYQVEVISADKRSLAQNAYLHAVLIPEFGKALNSVGYNEVKTNEQAKLIMKSMFLTREIPSETGGKAVHYVEDTHNLTKAALSDLIEEVIQFCAVNCSYVIPYPNEQLTVNYGD